MNVKKLLVATAVTLVVAVSGFAQEKPGNIAGLEFQKPKNGMVKQYEEGRKTKAAWHKQQKDTQPLMVWQVISGQSTGTYIVGRVGLHWADMDKPSVPDQADLEEYTKVVAPAVESMTAQIVNKLLHLPTVRMKQAAVSADGVIYAEAVRHLFGLGEDER